MATEVARCTKQVHGACLNSGRVLPSLPATGIRPRVGGARNRPMADDDVDLVKPDARDAGDSWSIIGAALDTTRQAAQQRFGA